eukprot:CAMPEP_0202905444 /NCGR_PEP_ID=MMETSP1392-20130828/34258_1 /ASSEMBLY_ACC=CAM_ASM_000868 /TAXON_ID=225041 /ORGANISM="Chlamydomonas chlamydogama, Strain SAG 11-48b" /LENGTH=49 /DNA_ID= /DNA_START= /DNA_END= /DNA_ORIENTATION=
MTLHGSLQTASCGAYMGPVLGALAGVTGDRLQQLCLWDMLLSRACLQQL